VTIQEEIQREAELCRKAFVGVQVGALVSHCHHEQWLEWLTEPAENRIQFILANKALGEQAERLRRFRPFDLQKADADLQKAYADRQKAYADLQKAYADRQKADADRQKADADRQKADADLQKADTSPAMLRIHAEVCGCPWGLNTDIFGANR